MRKRKSAYLANKERTQQALESIAIGNDQSNSNLRVPVMKLRGAASVDFDKRRMVSVGQLSVLLWCLYRITIEPGIQYMDSEVSFTHFNQLLNKNALELQRLDLERLLFAANEADKLGYFWTPSGQTFAEFVKPMLHKNEAFDREWNVLVNKKDITRMRSKSRYLKSLVSQTTSKRGNSTSKRGNLKEKRGEEND